ncbi:MAG: hypothetical protein M1819_005032 [Sarea resinae]|nr:MAG: hypothetical protein M1819_005032 [Sarea resinae]
MAPVPYDGDVEFLDSNLASLDIPEDDDLLMDNGEPARILTPPARIAARFFRPSSDRRKPSAASSRRSSVSSAHSHHSGRSIRDSHQSAYVAQHLRRASILENRKARLADRAAHAEKVRMRAAMAKAGTRPSNTEEKALAVQQAREKYLAQVAAACAEEVNRAKKIAEDMKEKKAAELRKLRGDMEERLAEAEKRRLEYKRSPRRSRTTSLPAMEGKKVAKDLIASLNDDVAAVRIQRAWRSMQRGRVIKEFLSLGLSIEEIRNTSFEDVGALLSEDKVISSTAKVLKLCGLQDVGGGAVEEKAAVRTFLSAFLILGHPTQVLSNDGEQEQDLITKSKDLLISFEHLLSRLAPGNSYTPPPMPLESLAEAYGSFCTAFTAWKVRDSSTLVQIMLAQYVQLDLIWQTVKNDTAGDVASDYREGIRENQIMLFARIKRLAGSERCKTMITHAIREGRREARAKAKKRPTGDSRPRATVEVPSNASRVEASHPAAERPPPVEVHPELQGPQLPSDRQSIEAAELTRIFSSLPDNRTLVHELAINKEYRIDPTPKTEVIESINNAVFSSMRSDVEAGFGDRWIVAMAENIRARLLRLLTPGNSLHTLISEALDPAVVQSECNKGSFSYEKFFSFMLSILPRLCAPVRDSDIKALAEDESGDVIDRLARLMHVIDLLSLDFANFLLQESAPGLIGQAPEYERNRFAQDLDSKVINLQRTERWWRHAQIKVSDEASRRDPEGLNLPINRPTITQVYMQGLADLSIATSPLLAINLPDTLNLDKDRIIRIRGDVLTIVAVGAIMLTAKNLLKRDVRSQWKPEATRIWDLLRSCDPSTTTSTSTTPSEGPLSLPSDLTSLSSRILSILESAHAMPAPTKSALGATISRVLTEARTTSTAASPTGFSHPVLKLLFQRLKTHVLRRLSATSAGERVRAVSTASEGLAASGLPEFIPQIGSIVDELGRVAEVDWKAHGGWYEGIAKEVEGAMGRDLLA